MLNCIPGRVIVAVLILSGMTCGMLAQEGKQPAKVAPLAFKVDWVRPHNQDDTKVRYTPVQENIADPNVVMTFYGKAAKQILTTGLPNNDITPYGVWTGTAEDGPFAVTFKLKDKYVDLIGLANIRWYTDPCPVSFGSGSPWKNPSSTISLPSSYALTQCSTYVGAASNQRTSPEPPRRGSTPIRSGRSGWNRAA